METVGHLGEKGGDPWWEAERQLGRHRAVAKGMVGGTEVRMELHEE